MGEVRKTFDEVADEWLARQKLYGRDTRTMGYQVQILARYFGGHPLADIAPRDIENMIAARLADGIQPVTTNRQRAALSGIFSFAIFEGYHPGPNPVRRVRKFKESTGRIRFLSRDEARRLVGAAPAHIKPILLFGIFTGGRLRELLGLRWSDIEIFPRPVECDNGRKICGMVHFRQENAKGGKYRAVPMCAELATVIRYLRPGAELDLLFTWRGRPLKSIRTGFEVARENAGLGSDVVVHTLRHTFCSWYMMEEGSDLYALKELAGHSTIAVTQKYAHVSSTYIRKSGAFIAAPRETETQD